MSDLISRQAAIDAICIDWCCRKYSECPYFDNVGTDERDCDGCDAVFALNGLPSAQPEPSEIARDIATIIENEKDMRVILKNAQPERKKGKWLEKEVIDDRKDAKIKQWQQARCSCCNKWHTTPYLYYFVNYDFCPNCGADMRERKEE